MLTESFFVYKIMGQFVEFIGTMSDMHATVESLIMGED